MFNSTILDVAAGLVFTFFAVSLATSAITEAIASAMMWRSKNLLTGIKHILNDPDFTGLALRLYKSALINPRDSGTAVTEADIKFLPAYIDPKQFANAVLQIADVKDGTLDALKAKIVMNIPSEQLQHLLVGIVDRAGGKADEMRTELASWFDNSMDRVSGAYKRQVQLWSFLIALVLAMALNIDTIQVGKALWQQPMLTKSIVVAEGVAPADALAALNELPLPIGWTWKKAVALEADLSWLEALAGWLITALATLFGAAFWFDLLQNITRLKGAGPSPAEKQKSLGAAA